MDISQRAVRSYSTGDRRWVTAEVHGARRGNDTITLNLANFVEADHFPDGYIPGGTVLGKITADSTYAPYDDAAVDGTEVAAGFLYEDVPLTAASIAAGTGVVAGALLWRGKVNTTFLPLSGVTGELDAAGQVDLAGHFHFIT